MVPRCAPTQLLTGAAHWPPDGCAGLRPVRASAGKQGAAMVSLRPHEQSTVRVTEDMPPGEHEWTRTMRAVLKMQALPCRPSPGDA